MKFLVVGTNRVSTSRLEDPLAAQKAAKAYIEEGLASGKFDCAYQFADGGGGMAIVNVGTAEELWEAIADYPMASLFDWEATPLADIIYVAKNMIKRMGG